jgi:hypothetical protein
MRAAGIDVALVLGTATVALAITGLVLRLSGLAPQLRGLRWLQIPMALVYAALAVLAFRVPPEVATAMVAAGLIAHAAWDVVQWRADAVLARSFAEWCAVYDLVIGVGLLVVLATSAV